MMQSTVRITVFQSLQLNTQPSHKELSDTLNSFWMENAFTTQRILISEAIWILSQLDLAF